MKMSFRVQGRLYRYDHSKCQEENGWNEAAIWIKVLITCQGHSYSVRYARSLDDPYDEKSTLEFLRKEHPHLLPVKKRQSNLSRAEIVSLLKELFSEASYLWVIVPDEESPLDHPVELPLWRCPCCGTESLKERCCGNKNRKDRSHSFNDRREFFALIANETEDLYDVISGVVA